MCNREYIPVVAYGVIYRVWCQCSTHLAILLALLQVGILAYPAVFVAHESLVKLVILKLDPCGYIHRLGRATASGVDRKYMAFMAIGHSGLTNPTSRHTYGGRCRNFIGVAYTP